MDIISFLTTLSGAVVGLGGIELIKWLHTRKSSKRLSDAQADSAEIKADTDEFHGLREQITFLQEQLVEKEKRFAGQTKQVRKLTKECIASTKKIGQLEVELALKRCEKKKCPTREPQNGY